MEKLSGRIHASCDEVGSGSVVSVRADLFPSRCAHMGVDGRERIFTYGMVYGVKKYLFVKENLDRIAGVL